MAQKSANAPWHWRWLTVALVALSPWQLAQAQPGVGTAPSIEFWTRASGDHAGGAVDREHLHFYQFAPNDLEERTLVDPQYDKVPRRYRGVALGTLMNRYGPEGCDLALLHFQNGMIIPLPLQPSVLERTDAFVAQSLWVQNTGEPGQWEAAFPAIEKRDTGLKDRRPIQFNGNKLVVKTPWHPMVSTKPGALFSPWLHADSLTGVEFVDSAAYYRQFQVATSDLSNGGYAIFLGRCQFCHGARNVGAQFGWDFVEPIPLHTYRNPDSLFLHMRYRDGLAPEKGLMMPAFKDLSPKDSQALWFWLKDLGEHPLRAYTR